jgi:hypothetical protein
VRAAWGRGEGGKCRGDGGSWGEEDQVIQGGGIGGHFSGLRLRLRLEDGGEERCVVRSCRLLLLLLLQW